MVLKIFNGQSNYDLCLKSVGSLDSFISLISSNGATNSSIPLKSVSFDSNLILNKLYSGYNYCTGINSIGFLPLLNNDGTPLLNNDGTPLFNN